MDVLGGMAGADGLWARLKTIPSVAGAVAAMESINAAMPLAAIVYVAAIVDRIDAGDSPLLNHCTAGKDRTGFVSVLLLPELDVS